MEKLVKLPKTKKDLRIKHFKAFSDPLVNFDNPTLQDKCYFLSLLTGSDVNTIKEFTLSQLVDMYEHVENVFDGFKFDKMPPKEIDFGGKIYELINPHKVATSWHIDFSDKDINKDPIALACMFYFPKGEIYGKLDDNGNFIHPISERRILIEQHMDLITFIEANAFFLNNCLKYKRRYMVKESTKRATHQKIQKLRGLLQ